MLHTFAVVSVDDVDQAVLGLDDRRVAVFTEVALPNDVFGMRSNLVFESKDGFPRVAILGHESGNFIAAASDFWSVLATFSAPRRSSQVPYCLGSLSPRI